MLDRSIDDLYNNITIALLDYEVLHSTDIICIVNDRLLLCLYRTYEYNIVFLSLKSELNLFIMLVLVHT